MTNPNPQPWPVPQGTPAAAKPQKPKRFGWIAATLFALGGLTLGGLAGGAGTDAASNPTDPPITEAATEPTEEIGDEPTTTGPTTAGYTPKKSDFAVSIKQLSKQCYGSAGCNVEYRPRIKDASNGRLPSEGTIEVGFKITGAEDPIEGTFTIDLDSDSVEGQDDDIASTPRSSSKLKIAITDMEYSE